MKNPSSGAWLYPPDKGGQGGWFPAEGGRAGRVKYYSLRLAPILPCHERSLPGRVRPPTPLVRGAFSTTPRRDELTTGVQGLNGRGGEETRSDSPCSGLSHDPPWLSPIGRHSQDRPPCLSFRMETTAGADYHAEQGQPKRVLPSTSHPCSSYRPLIVINRHGAHGRACALAYLERQAREDELRVHHFFQIRQVLHVQDLPLPARLMRPIALVRKRL